MSQKSANSTQNVLYVIVKHENRIYFQKKEGNKYQLLAVKVTPAESLPEKAINLLENKIDEILKPSEFRQISSKNYHDKNGTSQKCFVFLASLKKPLDEEKLSNVASFDINNIKDDKLYNVDLFDISKKIIQENLSVILREN